MNRAALILYHISFVFLNAITTGGTSRIWQIIAGTAWVNAPATNIAMLNSEPPSPAIMKRAIPHTALPPSIEIMSAG